MKQPRHIVVDARIRRSSTGRYTDRLIEHLQQTDPEHRYTILLQPDDPWQPTAPNFHPLPCPFPQFSFNPVDQFRFTRMLHKLRPDLVHFTMTQQPLPYLGKIVTTTHDLTMLRFVRRGTTPLLIYKLKALSYRLLFWWAHVKSNKIIVPTNFVAHDLSAYQPFTTRKLTVTPEATEPPLGGTGERPPVLEKSDGFIMYVGTAFPHKNLSRLVDAFDLLHEKYPALKLVLAGKKEINYQELESYIQSHPSKANIIVTGYIPDQQLKWLYEHCQAYVFPSLSEGFGLPGLEAMAHGAPVVSSSATCLPEVYGEAAHYFNPLNPGDIAKSVAEVIDDSDLRRQLIARGKQQISKYSWHKMAEQTQRVYEEVLGETTPR